MFGVSRTDAMAKEIEQDQLSFSGQEENTSQTISNQPTTKPVKMEGHIGGNCSK